MKNIIYMMLVIGFTSCATSNITNSLNIKDFDDELLETVTENISFDPYANKLYITEEPITTEYRIMVRDYVNALEDTNDVILRSPKNYEQFVGALMESRTSNYIFHSSNDWSNTSGEVSWYIDYKKAYGFSTYNEMNRSDIQKSSKYNDWDLESTRRKYQLGWAVRKTGPAKSIEGFQYFEIPMSLYYFVAFEGIEILDNNYGSPQMFEIPFIFKQEASVTLEADAKKTDDGGVVKIESENKPESDVFEDLKKLDDLYKAGILTEEEYNAKKAELLERI